MPTSRFWLYGGCAQRTRAFGGAWCASCAWSAAPLPLLLHAAVVAACCPSAHLLPAGAACDVFTGFVRLKCRAACSTQRAAAAAAHAQVSSRHAVRSVLLLLLLLLRAVLEHMPMCHPGIQCAACCCCCCCCCCALCWSTCPCVTPAYAPLWHTHAPAAPLCRMACGGWRARTRIKRGAGWASTCPSRTGAGAGMAASASGQGQVLRGQVPGGLRARYWVGMWAFADAGGAACKVLGGYVGFC